MPGPVHGRFDDVPSSTLPSQSSSRLLQVSTVPPVAVQPTHAPFMQTSVPAVHTPTSDPHGRVRSSSTLVSQSSSLLLQSSTEPQLVHAPSSMMPSQSSSRLL